MSNENINTNPRSKNPNRWVPTPKAKNDDGRIMMETAIIISGVCIAIVMILFFLLINKQMDNQRVEGVAALASRYNAHLVNSDDYFTGMRKPVAVNVNGTVKQCMISSRDTISVTATNMWSFMDG